MAISLSQLTRANQPKPPRITIHGVAGVGKTTFAAQAYKPVFIQTEDGLGTLSANHFPLARTFEEVLDALAALYTEEHDFKTVVIDSVDWLEPLIWGKACRDNGWASIEDAGYGKGYVAATGNLSVTTNGALELGLIEVGGELSVVTNNGSITQTGALRVVGFASLNAGSGAIKLSNPNNYFPKGTKITGTRVTVTGDANQASREQYGLMDYALMITKLAEVNSTGAEVLTISEEFEKQFIKEICSSSSASENPLCLE